MRCGAIISSQQRNTNQNPMKLAKKLWLTGALVVPCLPVLAQNNSTENTSPPPALLFRANETSLDLSGSVSVGQETINNISSERVEDNGRLGAGLGLNHFFTRHVGLVADAYTENAGHSFVDNTSGNLIVRFPFESIHLAPYVYGGAGYQFDPSGLWFGQAGGGLEFRLSRQAGLFADARYVFTDGTQNFGVARLGLRLAF
jgi:hypothetical protein